MARNLNRREEATWKKRGRWSGKAVVPVKVSVDDNTLGISNLQWDYSAGWTRGAGTEQSYVAGDHYTKTANATATIRFKGTSVEVRGTKAANGGMMNFSLDGTAPVTFDTYQATREDNVVLFTASNLSDAQHTLVCTVTGTKNAASTDNYVSIDQAVITSTEGTVVTPENPTPPPVTGNRDVTLHPYRGSWKAGAANGTWSIWNTPIGSGAVLKPANLGNANAWEGGKMTVDPIHLGYATDPVRTITTDDSRVVSGWSARVRVPSNDTGPGNYQGGNNICGYPLENDPTRLWCGHPLLLSAGGNPHVTGYMNPTNSPDDLYGQGHFGSHGGAHMSANACVRRWEWDSPREDAIQHAVPVNIYGLYMSYTNVASQQGGMGWRWPANSADSGAPTNYQGSNTSVKMGTLLTLPVDYNWQGIADLNARKLVRSIWAFGWYVVDDSAWNVYNLGLEKGIEIGSLSMTGFHNVLMSALMATVVVDNNLPTSVGGGGTPRVPLIADVTR